MKKRGKIRLTIFAISLPIIFCGLWCDALGMLNRTALTLDYSYRRALNDLTDSIAAMGSTLEKAPFVGTPVMQTAVTAQLSSQSGTAKAALSVLPLSQERTEKISRFLSQSGDYALSLSRRAASGEGLTDNDVQNLAALAEYAQRLEAALQAAQAQLAAGESVFSSADSLFSGIEDDNSLPTLDDHFDNVSARLAELPSLLYDGPFSDHLTKSEPLFLVGKPEVSQNDAAKVAADFLNCSTDELTFTGSGGDKLAVYSFTHDGSHVNITKQGGVISYFKKEAIISRSKLDYNGALEKATEILRQMGVDEFTETYYVINDNLCTINFAAVSGANEAVVYYPDLIKVTLELEQGGMVEFDMTGYLMNHRERERAQPSLSAEQAAQSLSSLLTVSESRLAVIPNYSQDETLCYEFLCTADNEQELLVYINCETGLEEQIYILQRDDHGVLVI